MNKFRLGIIGTGLITRDSHLPAALGLPEVEVTALIDPVMERAQQLAQTYGFSPKIAADIKDVLDIVDGVIIATPNATHCPIALVCIDAGIHVLIEKPLANTISEGIAIEEAASRKGIVVASGFCTRFRPNVSFLKELLDENYFGPIIRFVHQFGTAGGWAPLSAYNLNRQSAGGGVLVVSGSHFLDRMLYFWGYPLQARLTDDGINGPEANCTAHFTYNGFEGITRYSKTTRLPSGLAIETTQGLILMGDFDNSPIKFFPTRRPGVCETISRDGPAIKSANVFQLQILDFIKACRTGCKPLVDANQGVESIRLADMLYSNRTVVQENWYS